LIKVLVLKYLIARDVKAGGVGQVVHIKRVLQVETLGDAGHFHQ